MSLRLRIHPKRPIRVFLYLLLLIAILIPEKAQAIQPPKCKYLPPVEWEEKRNEVISLIYPNDYATLANDLLVTTGDQLIQEYKQFEILFNRSLSLPIAIRIYPTLLHYECLNAIATDAPPQLTHHVIGLREIALIGENILLDPSWTNRSINTFRYDFAILFAKDTSGGKAPPGLLAGVGTYFQDPFVAIENNPLLQGFEIRPDTTWRRLWESEIRSSEPAIAELSVTAFLIDVYDWTRFLDFLTRLSTAKGYSSALTETYRVSSSELQDQWKEYVPIYQNERWRYHIIYNYDLDIYRKLLESGAYRDAELGLKKSIEYLTLIGQSEKLAEAHKLLEIAKEGQVANSLVKQARVALQSGEYEQSLIYTKQAEERFIRLNDRNRMDELTAYRERAEMTLFLQSQLDKFVAQISSPQTPLDDTLRQVITIGEQLASLGDDLSLGVAREAVRQAQIQKEAEQMVSIKKMSLYVIALLFVRLLYVLRKPPIEANL